MAVAATTAVVSAWPDHMIPICVDGRVNKPFGHVLDVAHLVDYCALHYFVAPTLVAQPPPAPQPQWGQQERRGSQASAASAAGRRRSVAFSQENAASSPTSRNRTLSIINEDDVSALSVVEQSPTDISSAAGSPSPAGSRRRSSFGGERYEVALLPTGTFLIAGATLTEPAHGVQFADGEMVDVVATSDGPQRSLSDDEKFFVLRLPNQRIFLKPKSPEQLRTLREYLPRWIRVAKQQMFNSRMLMIRAEFTAVPLGRLGGHAGGADPSNTDDAITHDLQQQHALKEDLDFCRHLSTAIFAFGAFSNARDATSDKGVPEGILQRHVALSGGTSSPQAAPPSVADHSSGSSPRRPTTSAPDAALGKKYSTVLLPFSFGSVDRLAVAVKHDALGWFVPSHHRAGATIMQLLANHDVCKEPFQMELTPKNDINASQQGGSGVRSSSKRKDNYRQVNSRIRVFCKFSWTADENYVLRVGIKASNLIRRDFHLTDPLCFVSAKPVDEAAAHNTLVSTGGNDPNQGAGANAGSGGATSNNAPPVYKCVTEAYRNKSDVEFVPLSFALPVEIPTVVASLNVADFMAASDATTTGGAQAGGRHPPSVPMLQSKLFPPSILPPVRAPQPTLADMRTDRETLNATVATNHRYGDDILLPYVQLNELLTIEVVDAVFDAVSRDTLPSLIGSASVNVRDLVERATKNITSKAGVVEQAAVPSKGKGAHPVGSRLPLTTSGSGSVNITAATPQSTVDRLRARQKRRFPAPLSRFVFTSLAEATSVENAHMLVRTAKGPEVSLGNVSRDVRPSFLSFFQGGQWDLSSMIVVDGSSSSLWSHYNSYLPNDMGDVPNSSGGSPRRGQDRAATSTRGKNVYETIITVVNRLLIPMLTRGGSDLYMASNGQDGAVGLSLLHHYPEGFGVHVDETSLSERRGKQQAKSVFSTADIDDANPRRGSVPASLHEEGGGALVAVNATPPDADVADGVYPAAEDPIEDTNVEEAPPTPPGQEQKASKVTQVFSVIRDWGGEGTLAAYREKLESIVLRARSLAGLHCPDDFLDRALAEIAESTADGGGSPRKVQTSKAMLLLPPPPSAIPRQPMLLLPILRRTMMRCIALTQARKATVRRVTKTNIATKPKIIAKQVYHVVTVVVHSEIEDAHECVAQLLSWLDRPVFFVIVFLDDAAPTTFSGISNCITVDMTCCSRAQQQEQRTAYKKQQRQQQQQETSVGSGSVLGGGGLGDDADDALKRDSKGLLSGVCHSLNNFEVPLVAVHKQLHSIEAAMQRIPLGFLSFARLAGVAPEGNVPLPRPLPQQRPSVSGAGIVTSEDVGTRRPAHDSTEHHSTEPSRQAASTVASKSPDDAAAAADAQTAKALQEFSTARDKFLYAFGFKKRPPPPKVPVKVPPPLPSATVPGGTPPPSILAGPSGQAAQRQRGTASKKTTFAVENEGGDGGTTDTLDAEHSRGNVDDSLAGALITQSYNDFRSASVALVDVYMNDEQIREWEVDPQRLRQKLQSYRPPSANPFASPPQDGSPLIDDSLIRLHMDKLKSSSDPDAADDDIDDTSVIGQPIDAHTAMQVFSRRTKYEGHLHQTSVRVSGIECFTNKLPAPPGAGGGNRRSARRTSQQAAREGEAEGGADATEKSTGDTQAAQDGGPPLTAKQMAEKREKLATQQAVDRALRQVVHKTNQHLQKPTLHSRLLKGNEKIDKRRKSSLASVADGGLLLDDGSDDDDGHSRKGSVVSTAHGASVSRISDDGAVVLKEHTQLYRSYLRSNVMRQQTELNLIRLEGRPSTAASSRSSSRLSTLKQPTRPESARTTATTRRTPYQSKPTDPSSVEADDDASIRFQPLAFDKKTKLTQLLGVEQRSFGGPRLNEELVYEQEAERERRELRDIRKRETERIEEAYRSQKSREQLERNRVKLKQMLTHAAAADEGRPDDDMDTTTDDR